MSPLWDVCHEVRARSELYFKACVLCVLLRKFGENHDR